MTEVDTNVIEKIVQPIWLGVMQGLLSKSLQTERLVREKEAKQGSLVLTKAAEGANQRWQHSRMQGIHALRQVHQLLALSGAHPAQLNGFAHRVAQGRSLRLRNLVKVDIQSTGN